jgi:hypothetical protein
MIRMEAKVPGRREEALARAAASAWSVSNPHNKPKGHSRKVGHYAAVHRPRRFCVQLDMDDLYMLVIPNEFRPYVKGRPYPQLVSSRTVRTASGLSMPIDSKTRSSLTMGGKPLLISMI